MTETPVLLAKADGVATITLNRPDKLNAFTGALHEALRLAVEDAAADDGVGALLLTGAGRAFCAGQDLGERAMSFGPDGEGPDVGESLERYYNPLVRMIRGMEKPVVAAVNGVAAGAGANLALACDMVLAARSAVFIQAFCRIGLIPDAGGTWHLPRLVGRARALGLALTGEKLPAETAEEWGLIWKCVDDDKLMGEAGTLARGLAAGPRLALGWTKSAMESSLTNDLDTQLDLERDLQQAAGKTADFREGVAAFTEKRAARFEGR